MADDDIIELTDIVQKGHVPAQTAAPAAVQGSTSAAEAQMPDFGADLDELLQNYDKPASAAPAATAPAAEQSRAAPAPATAASAATAVDQAVAAPAPIANQESTDHKVDPNEELELPPLSDLDALLEELGVQDKAPAVDANEAALAGDDLDTVPSSDLTETVAPAAPDSPPASQVPDDSEVSLAAEVAEAQAAPAPVQAAAPAPAEAAAPAVAADESAGDEGIDLNELDALLDSVLASAPKSAPAPEPAGSELPTPEPKGASKAQKAPEPAAPIQAQLVPDDTAVADLRAEVASLRAELDDLRTNIDKYAAAAAAKVIREELAVIAASLE